MDKNIPINPQISIGIAIKRNRKKNEEKQKMRKSEELNFVFQVPCNTSHNNKRFQCVDITEEDLKNFKILYLEKKDRYSQDCFISSFLKIHKPHRRRPRNFLEQNKARNFAADYSMTKVNGQTIGVCKSLFQTVIGIKRKRLANISQQLFETQLKESKTDKEKEEKPKRKYKKTIEREKLMELKMMESETASVQNSQKVEETVQDIFKEPDIFDTGFLNLCRICLKNEENLEFIPIFDLNSNEKSHADQIEYCLGIKIEQNEELPANICSKCVERIENASILKADSLESQKVLNEYLSATKTQANCSQDVIKCEDAIESDDKDLDTTKSDNEQSDDSSVKIIKKSNKLTRDSAKTMVPVKCFLCDVEFKEITPEEHFEQHHKEIKLTKCPDCDFETYYPWYLNLHYQVHYEAFKLCQNCGKLVKSTSFFSHCLHCTRNKEGMKKHQCNVCNKAYHKAYLLKVHLRTHTGEKPYSCEDCGEKFSKKILLRKHMLSHGVEPKFRCEFCEKGFIVRHRLLAHRTCCARNKVAFPNY